MNEQGLPAGVAVSTAGSIGFVGLVTPHIARLMLGSDNRVVLPVSALLCDVLLMAPMDDLYRQQIIDRYKNPLMRGELDPHDYSYEDDNPLCGDRIRIDLRVDGQGRITEAAFSGTGCAISQASADMLVESVIGKSLEEVKSLSKEELLGMLGIELGPVRLKCALLSLKVLKAGVYGVDQLEADLADA